MFTGDPVMGLVATMIAYWYAVRGPRTERAPRDAKHAVRSASSVCASMPRIGFAFTHVTPGIVFRIRVTCPGDAFPTVPRSTHWTPIVCVGPGPAASAIASAFVYVSSVTVFWKVTWPGAKL